jgi:LPXTG-motif cell wall-anchored protein
MKLTRATRKFGDLLVLCIVCVAFAATMLAQVQTQTTASEGQAQVQTKVERGEVVSVNGNDLIVKTEDGQIHHFPNVPDSVKVTVNGQELSVHELKPGMKLERTITTTTTPRTVTTVKKVTGTVWNVMPPDSVILTLENGKNQQFKIPKDQKFNVDGQEVDAFALKKGMRISATKIVEVPENVIAEQRKVTGQMPPPPPASEVTGPLLIQQPAAPTEVAEAKPPEKLPQTGSKLPLIGLLGVFSLLAGLGLRAVRLRTD